MVQGDKDFHSKYGVVSADDLKNAFPGDTVKSHLGTSFAVLEPNTVDHINKARKGPQTVTLKDCGIIVGYTGISSGSKVVDAGTGSGYLSMFLANLVYPETLVTYEVRDDFANLAEKNFQKAAIENIKLKRESIYEGIEENDLDLITLDLPRPWKVVEHAQESLKPGGYLVSYSPSIEQSKKLTDALDGFKSDTFECIKRDWNMYSVRPYTRMLGHTGFITIARYMNEEDTD